MVKGFSNHQEHNTGRRGSINPTYVERPLGLHDASGKNVPYFMCTDGCIRPADKQPSYKSQLPSEADAE